MHRRSLTMGIAATAVAAAIAGCGSSSDSSSTSGASSSGAASSSAAATPMATIPALKGVSTTVDLDPGTVGVLTQNMVMVAPVAPATAQADGAHGGGPSVSFPITGGNVSVYDMSQTPFVRGKITHSGGVTFSGGGKSLTATDFIVDPGASTLTATVGGSQVHLLDLNGSGVKIGKDAAGHVLLDGPIAVLSQAAADALNATFGVNIFKQGIPLGVVHIIAG